MKLTWGIAALVIYACPFFYSQSLGFSIGYGTVNMDGVNTLMDQVKSFYSDYGIYSEPEKVKSGLFLEGSFKYAIGNAGLGLLFDHISSSGSYGFTLPSGSDQINFDVSTNELMGLLEFAFGSDSSAVKPFVKVAGGIGFASAEFEMEYRYYQDPSYNETVKQPLSGTYVAGRIEGGLQFIVKTVTLEFAAGYRIADARDLKGDQTFNDYTINNVPLLDTNQNPVEFDYSGFLITGGIAVRLW